MLPLNRILNNHVQIRKLTFLRIFSSDNFNPKALKVGDSCTITKQISNKDIENFAKISGDTNPVHFQSDSQQRAVVHGAFLNGLVSGVIGTKLPGPGTLVISQNLNFPNKCFGGESVKITVKLVENRKIIKVDFVCEVEEQKKVVLHGDARLVVSKSK